MTGEHIDGIAARYNAVLQAGAVAERENGGDLEHARWMCQRIREFVREREYDKANRWLGFVQGVLYAHRIYSIGAMRDHNRTPDEQKSARTQMTDELVTALDVAVFPGTNVFVAGHGRDTVVVTTRQPDGTFRRHWLQVREVTEVASPAAP